MVSSLQNFYESQITRNWTATTGDFNVSVAPSISSGYIVISPSDRVRREIVKFSATGTNGYGPFITVSNISDRGVGGTTAQTHTIGEKVRMNITAQHWDELVASAVAPTVDVGTTTTLEPGSDATATNSGTDVAAVIDFEIPSGSTIYSGTSIPDNSVGRNGDWAFDTSVNCYVWYKSGGTWALVNSLKGATGDGNGIASITKTGTVGLVDTYTITYDDDTTSTFNITNGAKGDTGDDGVSVVSIIKTDTVGLVDTYTITYSNSTTSTFTVTNGQDGTDGIDGTNGIDGTDGISFTPKGAYNALTEYIANDVVSYLGSSWIALQTTTGNTPSESAYWTLNAEKGTDGEGSGDVTGPAGAVADNIAVFDSTTGKIIKDGGKKISELELVANKSTTLDTDKASDIKYPSVKSVYDWAVGLFQTLANKVTSFQATPDDTHYPSEKLVKDSLDAKAPNASPTFTGTVTTPAIKITTGAGANKVLTSDADGDATWETPSGGTSLWTAVTGTRASNTTITVATDLTAIFKKGMIVRWQESGVDKVAVISIPSTYSSPNTTITICGDTCSSIDSGTFKYSSILDINQFTKNFAIAGNIGATVTDAANAFYADMPYRVIGSEIYAGSAGTTNSTSVNLVNGTGTVTLTSPSLATTVAFNAAPTAPAASGLSLALNDRVQLNITAIQTTNCVDLYVKLLLFPVRYLSIS